MKIKSTTILRIPNGEKEVDVVVIKGLIVPFKVRRINFHVYDKTTVVKTYYYFKYLDDFYSGIQFGTQPIKPKKLKDRAAIRRAKKAYKEFSERF